MADPLPSTDRILLGMPFSPGVRRPSAGRTLCFYLRFRNTGPKEQKRTGLRQRPESESGSEYNLIVSRYVLGINVGIPWQPQLAAARNYFPRIEERVQAIDIRPAIGFPKGTA